MDDDLNTPKALAAMFDLSREMNRQRDDGHSIAAAQDCLRHLGSILGLTFQEREASLNVDATSYNAILQDLRAKIAETGENELAELVPDSDMEAVSAPDIDRLVDIRTTCRSYKQYALADEIRGWLESQGISVEDSAAGSIWEYRPNS
jgi:cysteinyl-tRNA synthetase